MKKPSKRIPKSHINNVLNYIDSIAGRLLAEGLTASTYTKAKAKEKTKDVVLSAFVHRMIDSFTPEIKKAMVKIRKQSNALKR